MHLKIAMNILIWVCLGRLSYVFSVTIMIPVQLVHDLEQEMLLYERTTLEPAAGSYAPPSKPRPYSNSGGGSLFKFMGSLLGSSKRMMQYLRQSDTQLKGEVAIRNQFLRTLHEQQDLMDAITAVSLRGGGRQELVLWSLHNQHDPMDAITAVSQRFWVIN